MKVLVAGAGIGGLSAAIALKRDGHEVKCFDRVREMRPIGAAISGELGRAFMCDTTKFLKKLTPSYDVNLLLHNTASVYTKFGQMV